MVAASADLNTTYGPSSGDGPMMSKSAVLHRCINENVHFPQLVSGNGSIITTADGRKIFDASGGAAVACIGHGNKRVREAVVKQMTEISYCPSTFYTNEAYEGLCRHLVASTNGYMARAYIVNSGKAPCHQYCLEMAGLICSGQDLRQWRRQ